MLPIGKRFAFEIMTSFASTSFHGENTENVERINSLIAYARGVYAVFELQPIFMTVGL